MCLHGIIHGRNFFAPPFRHVPQHHFKKKLSRQIQYWLHINCKRAFVWEMIYHFTLICHIKIKIKYPAGKNAEIMTFRYLKTLFLTSVFKNYNILWCFYFWGELLVITNPLFMIIQLWPPYTLIPPFISGKLTWPQKIVEVSSDSPIGQGGWCHGLFILIKK